MLGSSCVRAHWAGNARMLATQAWKSVTESTTIAMEKSRKARYPTRALMWSAAATWVSAVRATLNAARECSRALVVCSPPTRCAMARTITVTAQSTRVYPRAARVAPIMITRFITDNGIKGPANWVPSNATARAAPFASAARHLNRKFVTASTTIVTDKLTNRGRRRTELTEHLTRSGQRALALETIVGKRGDRA